MIKLKFNRATTWIGFILINMLAISCYCGESPEEKKLKDLQVKNKQATKKISEILKTKLNINPTPEQEKYIEKNIDEFINKIKKEVTLEEIAGGITTLKEVLTSLESMDDATFQEEIDKYKRSYMGMMGVTELDKISIDRDTVKQLVATILEIMQNIKEELELKNKGKKTSNKKRPRG